MEITMQTLPPEVLIGLLEYLPYQDRKSLSETSTHFNRLCLDRKYLEKEHIVFEDCVLSPENSPLNFLMKSERVFLNLTCINIDIDSKSDLFWRKFAPFCKSLTLRRSSISLNYVTCFFSYMKSLEYLEFDQCRDLFMSGTIFSKPDDLLKVSEALSSVSDLVVKEYYLSDALFNRLVTAMPNLSRLSLIGCYINFHEAVYKRYYNKDNPGSGSDSVLTFTFILSYLQKVSSSLKKLDFSFTKLNDSSLRRIASLDGLNLSGICLFSCSELTNGSIIDLVNSQKDLMMINIGRCLRLTDKALIAISDNLKKLRELDFSGCSGITNMGVSSLAKLSQLYKLSMMSYSEGSSGRIEGICTPTSHTIRFIDLRSLRFNEATLINLCSYLSNLVYLDLGLCLNAVSNLSLHAVFRNLRRLQHLKLRGCRKITDHGLCGNYANETSDPERSISPTGKNEDEVETHLRSAIIQDDFEQYNPLARNCSIANLKGLKFLELSYCLNITNMTLINGIQFLELRHLDLSYCEKITNDGLKILSKNNPSIEVLDLSGCQKLSDEGLIESIPNFHRLRHLFIKGVSQLSVAGLKTLKTKCKALKYVNVSQCNLNLEEEDLGSLLPLRVVSYN